jgi:hypothetical protein
LGSRGLTILGAAIAASLIAVPVVIASSGHDGGTLTLQTSAKAKLMSGKTAVFTVTSDAASALTGVTTTCTASGTSISLSGATPTYAGDTAKISNPTFSGCTDNLGGGSNPDTVTTNNTNGNWSAVYSDNASEASGEVFGSNDHVAISAPKAGLTDVSSAASTCTIVANPNGTDPAASGLYNDSKGSDTITNAALTFVVTGASCPLNGDTGTATFSATYVTSPKLTDS